MLWYIVLCIPSQTYYCWGDKAARRQQGDGYDDSAAGLRHSETSISGPDGAFTFEMAPVTTG